MPSETSDREVVYLDASALVKLILHERESAALRRFIDGKTVVSSELAIAEVPRAVARWDIAPAAREAIEALLNGIDLMAVTPAVLIRAAAYGEPGLRTLDAIHVASAQRALPSIERFVSYDRRQIQAASAADIPVHSPA